MRIKWWMVILVIGVVAWCFGGKGTQKSVSVGDSVLIQHRKAGSIEDHAIASTEEDEEAFGRVLNAHDEIGYQQLFDSGRMYRVPNGSSALVLGRTLNLSHVRIIGGINNGKEGWLPVEFTVKK